MKSKLQEMKSKLQEMNRKASDGKSKIPAIKRKEYDAIKILSDIDTIDCKIGKLFPDAMNIQNALITIVSGNDEIVHYFNQILDCTFRNSSALNSIRHVLNSIRIDLKSLLDAVI